MPSDGTPQTTVRLGERDRLRAALIMEHRLTFPGRPAPSVAEAIRFALSVVADSIESELGKPAVDRFAKRWKQRRRDDAE